MLFARNQVNFTLGADDVGLRGFQQRQGRGPGTALGAATDGRVHHHLSRVFQIPSSRYSSSTYITTLLRTYLHVYLLLIILLLLYIYIVTLLIIYIYYSYDMFWCFQKGFILSLADVTQFFLSASRGVVRAQRLSAA